MILGPSNDRELETYCDTNLMKSYFPPFVKESDLILRYLASAHKFDATHIVRITSDCWQMNPELIAECVQMMLAEKADYICNTCHRSFIEGLDLQACTVRALRWFDKNQTEQREHPFIEFDNNENVRKKFEKDGFKYIELINPKAEWTIRTSIDTKEDIERANKIYERFQKQSEGGKGLVRSNENKSAQIT